LRRTNGKKKLRMAKDITLPPERLFALLDRLVTVRIDIALDLTTLDSDALRERLARTATQVDVTIAELKDLLGGSGRKPSEDPEFELGKPDSGTKFQ
jgi:hypothetical protein